MAHGTADGAPSDLPTETTALLAPLSRQASGSSVGSQGSHGSHSPLFVGVGVPISQSSSSSATATASLYPPTRPFPSLNEGGSTGIAAGRNPHSRGRRMEKRARRWLSVWSPYSPYFRFFLLGLAILIPFGAHVAKYQLTPIAHQMMADPQLQLTHAEFGTFMTAVNLPNLLWPLAGGVFLDVRGSRFGTLVLLLLALGGQLLFTLAITHHSYVGALIGRIIFGLGQGSTVVAQGKIIAHWFRDYELTFAIGFSESVHSVSGWFAKVCAFTVHAVSLCLTRMHTPFL